MGADARLHTLERKKWNRGGEKWGGERNEIEKGGGGVEEGRETKAGKHNTKKLNC